MDILAVLDAAAELEDRVALLYHTFSQRFRTNPSGFSFWEQVSMDEKRHADMVRTYRRQRLILPVSRRDHPGLQRELEEVRRLVMEDLRQAEQEHIHTALEVAYQLEERLCQAHLSRVTEVVDPLLTKLLGKLGHEDRRHQERILHMARSLTP